MLKRVLFTLLTILSLQGFLWAQLSEDQLLLDSLDEEPLVEVGAFEEDNKQSLLGQTASINTENWESFYLKALYHQSYRLRLSLTEDQWGIPIGPKNLNNEVTRDLLLSVDYLGQAKIHISNHLFAYARFEYSFTQVWEQGTGGYRNFPTGNLYEAYLQYQNSKIQLQMGGLQMRLGVIDIDSPIDVLNLKNPDKVVHLDREDHKIVTPAAKLSILGIEHSWDFYWGPFQRVSEEDQSVRANLGIKYRMVLDNLDMNFMLFDWFDPDIDFKLEIDDTPTSDTYKEPLYMDVQDTPMAFVAIDLDLTLGDTVIKAETAYFAEKNIYHFDPQRLQEKRLIVLETLNAKQFVFALSVEKKLEKLFIMPVYSYRRLIDVPGNTIIFQYENLTTPKAEKRDLERHQLNGYLEWEFSDEFRMNMLVFSSFPFVMKGISSEWIWGDEDEGSSWKVLLSRVETEKNKLTGLPTILSRVQTSFTASF